MASLFTALTSKIFGGLALGFLAAGVALLISKNAEIRTLDKAINDPDTGYIVRLQAAERDLTQCRANRITIEDAARRQNDAVEATQRRGDERLAALGRTLGASAEQLRRANERAADILARVPGADECAAALELARETGQ